MEAATQQQTTKKCPACAETILAVAVKCKHCGERLGASPVAQQEESQSTTEQGELRSDPRTILGVILGTAPGAVFFGFFVLSAIAKLRHGYASADFGKSVLFGVVLAVLAGGLAGAVLTQVYPSAHKAKNGKLALLIFGAVYALALYFVAKMSADAWLNEEGGFLRNDGTIVIALDMVATAALATLLGARFTRKIVVPKRALDMNERAAPQSPEVVLAIPAVENRRADTAPPVETAECPYCGGKIMPGATTCMHCWKKLARK
jgi:hypothetical protein